MHRLFVALRPPPSIRRTLALVQTGVGGVRWQDDDQLHLTLRFIGTVDPRTAEDVAAALAAVAVAAPTLRITGAGRFDAQNGGAALWAGVTPRESLTILHRKVDQACIGAGLPPERRAYLPHITLARLPRSMVTAPSVASWLADHAALTSEAFTPAHLVLYESHLGRTGATYEAVARWPLRETRGESR